MRGSGTSPPAGARPTSAFISLRVTKLGPNDTFSATDDSIVAAYTELVRGQHPSDGFEIHGTRMMFGGRPAVGGVGVDISERVKQDEALSRSREQLQELTAYTSRKLEDQRLSFARDSSE